MLLLYKIQLPLLPAMRLIQKLRDKSLLLVAMPKTEQLMFFVLLGQFLNSEAKQTVVTLPY